MVFQEELRDAKKKKITRQIDEVSLRGPRVFTVVWLRDVNFDSTSPTLDSFYEGG